MWPFRKSASKADRVIAIMDSAAEYVSEKWTIFDQAMPFRDDIALVDRITSFLLPVTAGLESRYAALRNAPSGVVLMIVARGICLSGTHSEYEVEDALGVQLPDWKN